MEIEDVSAEVDWEARRIAAAFGVSEFRLIRYEYAHVSPFKHVSYSATHARYGGTWGQTKIGWTVVAEGTSLQDIRTVVLQSITIGDIGGCMAWFIERQSIRPTPLLFGGRGTS